MPLESEETLSNLFYWNIDIHDNIISHL